MISVQSHSKQIKLLNQYIQALEKQIASIRKESEEGQKISKTTTDDFRIANDELSKTRKENEDLKARVGRLTEDNNRFNGLQVEYFRLREFIDRQLKEKNQLIIEIQGISGNNKTLYDRMMELERILASQTESYRQEQGRMTEENEKLKQLLRQREIQFEEERANSLAKLSAIENNFANISKSKNDEINKPSREIEDLKPQLNNRANETGFQKIVQNQSVHTLNSKLSEVRGENERLLRENSEIKLQLDKKVSEIGLLSSNFNIKIRDYEGYVKRTNDEKASLLRAIRSLEEEKSNLSLVNSSFKGDVNETNRSLSTSLKKIHQLTLKLEILQNELTTLRICKTQSQSLISSLKKELEDTYRVSDRATRQKQQALERQSEVVRQRMNNQYFYNNEINAKEKQIKKLQEQIGELATTIKAKNKSISKLEDDLKEMQLEFSFLQTKSSSINGSASIQLQSVRSKLKQSQTKIGSSLEKIEQSSIQLKNMEIKYQNQKKTLQLTQKQLQNTHVTYKRQLEQLVNKYENRQRKKNDEWTQVILQKQELAIRASKIQSDLESMRQQNVKKQTKLRSEIKAIQFQRDSYRQKINTISLSSLVETHSKSWKQNEVSILNKKVTNFQIQVQLRQKQLQTLRLALADKQAEVEILEESNALLRKQIISSIKNQQASKIQLIEVRSRGSSITGSRIKAAFIQKQSKTQNKNKIPRHMRMMDVRDLNRCGSGQKRLFDKKKTLPTRSSMVPAEQQDEGGKIRTTQEIQAVLY